jgi:hypothetical protein
MIEEKRALLITNRWTGHKYLFPILYETIEEAVQAKNSVPQSTKNNTIEVVKVEIWKE